PGGALLLLGDGDLAALGRAVLRAGLGHALALAAVLAFAGVAGALAGSVALALVDAGTHHLVASLLLRLVLRERRARNEERGDGGGKDGVLHRHGFPPGSGTSARRYVSAAKPLHARSSKLKKPPAVIPCAHDSREGRCIAA